MSGRAAGPLAPAFAYLVAGGVLGLSTASATASAGPLAFTENPVRLIIYGAIYLAALAWLLRHASVTGALASKLWPLWLILAYAASSVLWSAVPAKVLIDTGHLTGAALVAFAAALAARDSAVTLARVSGAAAAIVIVASVLAVGLGLPGSIDPDSGRWSGTTGNANTLGLYCAIAIGSSALVLATSRSLFARTLAIVSIAAASYVLYRCGSMTSLVVAAFWLLGSFWMLTGRQVWRAGPVGRVAAGALLGVLLLVCAAALAPQMLDPNAGLQALGRSADFTGRAELWAFGWRYLGHEPLRGYGFDSLASILSASNTTVGQLHNGYLDLLLRGGAIAGVLFLLLAARGIAHCLSSAARSGETAWLAVTMGAVLLHNWTESSILRPVHPLWMMFLLACVAAAIRPRDASVHRGPQNDRSHNSSARPAALPNLLR